MKILMVLVLLTAAPELSFADEDPIGPNFFSPETVMNHQADIGLKDAQRKTIVDEMKRVQSNMVDHQFAMKGAMQELAGIVSQSRVDETKAITALQKLTKIETDVKSLHITLMIRIKNALTPEQQQKLRGLK